MRVVLGFFVFMLLSGCGVGGDFSDLQSFMDEVRARPNG